MGWKVQIWSLTGGRGWGERRAEAEIFRGKVAYFSCVEFENGRGAFDPRSVREREQLYQIMGWGLSK